MGSNSDLDRDSSEHRVTKSDAADARKSIKFRVHGLVHDSIDSVCP